LTRPTVSPPNVATSPVATSAARTVAPATTCLDTMALACSVVRLSRVPAGSLAKASSDGAKMVTASTPFRVSTRPRSETTLTKVVNAPAPTATSTTSPTAGSSAGSGAPKMTLSITWMTPLLALTSAVTTLTVWPL